jgi:hypothetical protein
MKHRSSPPRSRAQKVSNNVNKNTDGLSDHEQCVNLNQVKLIQTKGKVNLILGFKLVDTSMTSDANSLARKKIKPDISMYAKGTTKAGKKATKFDKLELSFELKSRPIMGAIL